MSEEVAAEEAAPASEEELPEDLFADLEMDSGDVSEEVAAEEVAPAFEEDEDVAAAELVPDSEEEVVAVEAIPDTSEEIAALVSAQVEEVVTRLVDERLPSIVERTIAQEIEKLKKILDSGE